MTGGTQATGTRIGYILGSDGQSGIDRDSASHIRNQGSTDIHQLRSGNTGAFVRLHIPRNYLRTRVKHDVDLVGAILNLVTDPDQNPQVLNAARVMLKGYKGRVFNRPEAVLQATREGVAARAAGIDGLVVPPVARFRGRPALATAAMAKARMHFPAILREAGTHTGRIRGIARNADEVLAAIRPEGDYVLVGFVDARRADGLFHKLRVFFFGGRGVLRHMLMSDHWNVHAADRMRIMADRPELIADEARLVVPGYDALSDAVRAPLEALRARLGLDFIGVDFAILRDGRVLLYEANPTMNFLPMADDPRFAHLAVVRAAGTAAFDAMLADAGVLPQGA